MNLHRHSTLNLTAVGVALLIALVCAGTARAQTAPSFTLGVYTLKSRYLPGEIVYLGIRLTNVSSAAISLPGGPPSVDNGQLRIFIAHDAADFKRYAGPGWGVKRSEPRPLVLAPGESVDTLLSVSFNRVIPTGHLSPLYAQQIQQGLITDEYAMRNAGVYRIKAGLFLTGDGSDVESVPRMVTVAEPAGDDVPVWEVLQTDGDYGYFIQTGSPRKPLDAAKTQQIVTTLERLVDERPASSYALSIRIALARYRVLLRLLELQ